MSFGFHTVSTVLMVLSLVFLLLGTISAPVVSSFALGETSSHRYGVFGLCSIKSGHCTPAQYPYTPSSVDLDLDVEWTLASSSRDNLAKIFILVPIGAGLSLITVVALAVGHLAGTPALIFAMVFNVITFIIAALVFAIVVVVFNPNVAWTGWILIGLVVTSLVSLVLLAFAIRFSGSSSQDDDDDAESTGLGRDGTFGATNAVFDEKMAAPRAGGYGDDASFKQSYQFSVQKPPTQVSKTLTNSSVYNSNPQLAKDFTRHDGPSNLSLGRTESSSYYEDSRVNLVNGPNMAVGNNRQMAPNVRPEMARPQMLGGQNNPPYPAQNPLDKRPYNPTDMSVFVHHPEVEGHRPFTELADDEPARANHKYNRSDEMDSDVESDFTSVSQRAPNPNYNPPPANYFPPAPQGQFGAPPPPPQGFSYAQSPQYGAPRPSNYAPPPPPQHQIPPQQYGAPMPAQQARGPTVSENILSQNPDFSFNRAGRRGGPQQAYKPGAARLNQRNLMGNRSAGFKDSPYGGF